MKIWAWSILWMAFWGCGAQQENLLFEPVAEDELTPIPVMEAKTLEGGPLNQQAVALLAQGLDEVQKGALDSAAAHFRESLEMESRLSESHYNLGLLEEQAGHWEAARKSYEAALSVRPDFGPAVMANASLIMRQEGFEAARRFAESCLAQDPEDLDLRNARNAVLLYESGHAAEVVGDSKQILRKDERNLGAHLNLSAAFYEQGKFEMSRQAAEDVLALDSENPEALGRKGLAELELGKESTALAMFEQAVAFPLGAQPEILNELGLLYHKLGDDTDAEVRFREALARWPTLFEAWVNLGNCLKAQGKYKESEEAFLHAKSLGSALGAEADYNLAVLYLDAQLPHLSDVERLKLAIEGFNHYLSETQNAPPQVEKYLAGAQKKLVAAEKKAEQLKNQPKKPENLVPAERSEEQGETENSDSVSQPLTENPEGKTLSEGESAEGPLKPEAGNPGKNSNEAPEMDELNFDDLIPISAGAQDEEKPSDAPSGVDAVPAEGEHFDPFEDVDLLSVPEETP